jgi:uncharacterized protein (DUF983 family)
MAPDRHTVSRDTFIVKQVKAPGRGVDQMRLRHGACRGASRFDSLSRMKLGSVFAGRCPSCDQGEVVPGLWLVAPKCSVCSYNFHPEPGFYLGAMMVGFLVAGALTIPPLIILKVLEVDIRILIAWPFVQYLILGTFILYYSRILWLHLEFTMTRRLEEKDRR